MSMEGNFAEYIDGIDAEVNRLIPIALARGAEHVRGVSVELAPIRDGVLRGSAGVTVSGNDAEVLYPGPYARRQHYGLDFKHPQGGQALFLEQPMITEAERVIQIMSDTLAEGME